MKAIKVRNMESNRTGDAIANQFVIETKDGEYLQSYNTIIAFVGNRGNVLLDKNAWNYSRTTAKYRGYFLHENTKETQAKIDKGEYKLVS